ncbi:MAG: protein jag, partial [Clostridiales bacterium]|nr:protein jag [Clostridiales bacterium]
MRYIDVTGKTEEEAIRAALSQLGLERDDVSVEILERSKSGFLGIGSSPAKVRVSYELDVAEEPEVPQAKPAEKKPVEKKPVEKKPVEKKPEGKPEPAPEKQPEQPAAPVSETEDADRIRAFLTGLLEHMDCRAQVKVYEEE